MKYPPSTPLKFTTGSAIRQYVSFAVVLIDKKLIEKIQEIKTIKHDHKMSDWDEVKRLAADFQRAQLSSTSHKLSERNCVELVQKLVNLGLVEVIYTTDGREYLTPSELEKEIKEELFVEGGKLVYYT